MKFIKFIRFIKFIKFIRFIDPRGALCPRQLELPINIVRRTPVTL